MKDHEILERAAEIMRREVPDAEFRHTWLCDHAARLRARDEDPFERFGRMVVEARGTYCPTSVATQEARHYFGDWRETLEAILREHEVDAEDFVWWAKTLAREALERRP